MAVSDEVARKRLDDIRTEIDSIDSQLIQLISRRTRLGIDAAACKRNLGMPIVNPEREATVIDQANRWAAEAGLPANDMERIFRTLIALSRRAQNRSQKDG